MLNGCFRNIGSETKFRNHPNGKEKHLNFGTKNMLSTLEITLSTTRLFLWPSSKRKCLKITKKSINLLQHEQRYLNFRAKKTYTFIGKIRVNFLFVIYTVFFSCAIFFGLSTLFSGLVYFYVASVHLFSVAIP